MLTRDERGLKTGESATGLFPNPASERRAFSAYDAALGRFLSADPLGLGGGPNVYAYCLGNPLAYIDPLGLCGVENRLEFNMPGFGESQSYQIVGGNVRNLTMSAE